MGLTSLGSSTIAVAVPGAAEANAALDVACGIAAPNVSAQITAIASFSPSVGLDFHQQLDLTADIVTNLDAALAAIPPIPTLDLSAQVSLALATKTALEAVLALVEAQVTIQANIAALLATAGVEGYAWDGRKEDLGAAITAALGADATHSNAVILLTTSGAAWTSMQGVFRTS